MPTPPLIMQTAYAELLERSALAAFAESFPEDGVFVVKTVNGRRYWYFQASSAQGRAQRYVGAETPELLDRIAKHREARGDERERRALVSALARSLGFSRVPPDLGDIVSALARAGVFRLRAVLVGTMAYLTYAPMLGASELAVSGRRAQRDVSHTDDVDIAQFGDISIAVGDRIPPILDVLQEVDPSFHPVPGLHKSDVTKYVGKGGKRIDFITPNVGPETDAPQRLPALQTSAQPLRFLDYLIRDPEPAVLLHDAGVYVQVPSPSRYAIHKLIISQRRPEGAAKRDKDIRQAQSLIAVLAEKRPADLRAAWIEAIDRGEKWRELALLGLSQLGSATRDAMLRVINKVRGAVPEVDLSFGSYEPHYDFDRDMVSFSGEATPADVDVTLYISGEALDDHFGGGGREKKARVGSFLANRSEIERLARTKYLLWPVEKPNAVFLRSSDIPELRRAVGKAKAKAKAATKKATRR